MPLQAGRAVHPRWSEHHRPTATSTMTASCRITRTAPGGSTGSDGTFNPPAAAEVYAGRCRVQALATSDRLEVVGEAQETHRRYLVAITYDAAEVHIGDLAEITEAVDAGLVGKQLRVVDVRYGSEQWQRDLIGEELEA